MSIKNILISSNESKEEIKNIKKGYPHLKIKMGIKRILLKEGKSLHDYLGYYPDEEEVLWEFIGTKEIFENGDIDPPKKMKVKQLFNSLKVVGGYETYKQSVNGMDENSKQHIKEIRNNIQEYVNDPIIIFDDELIDGYHRLISFYLEDIEYCKVLNLETMNEII